MIEVRLPWPPTINTYWRSLDMGHYAKVVLSKRARSYRKAVVSDIHIALGGRPEPMPGKLSVTLHLYPPDKRKRDADNHVKAVLDAMTHAGVWEDDSQVKDIGVYMHAPEGRPGSCIVTVMELLP